jgi:prephenate dehydratase
VNLVRIESRPRREGLGAYMFFVDLEGREDDAAVAEAVSGLAAQAAEVGVLGSYPAA